jgi:hypothetical protein
MEPSSSSLTPFAWVRKRDGRLVPFEADKISRALFAAGESAGQPDAFLARELTDSILHFLAMEIMEAEPTTAQIAECVAKIVRELGQPALARIYTDAGAQKQGTAATTQPAGQSTAGPARTVPGTAPADSRLGPALQECSAWIEAAPAPGRLVWHAGSAALRAYSLREIFTRDLVSAHEDGLLTLGGLEAPLELAGYAVTAPHAVGSGIVRTVEEARAITGSLLALDGPEYLLARLEADAAAALDFCQGFQAGLRLAQLQGVLNLNCSEPPPSEESLAVGPLFAGQRHAQPAGEIALWMDPFLEQLLATEVQESAVRVDWHVSERDFTGTARGRLAWLLGRSLQDAPVYFAFDRPGSPVPLGEGLNRRHPGSLLSVRLHLPRLLEQAGARMDSTIFQQKLVSLCRLALSAATQKRDFVRRHSQHRPALTRAFMLERARLVVVPVGLWQAVRTLAGRDASTASQIDLARKMVQHLQATLVKDGRSYLLDTCLDSLPDQSKGGVDLDSGLCCPDPTAAAKEQLKAAGRLHGAARMGTATIYVGAGQLRSAEEMVDCLAFAWQQTDVVRVRFVRGHPPRLQAPPLWAGDS